MLDKLQQAIGAIKSGNRKTGYDLLVEVIKAEPEGKNAETAWLWMAVVITDPQKKRQCLQTVLKLNPNNEKARKGMESLLAINKVTVEEPLVEEITPSHIQRLPPQPQKGVSTHVGTASNKEQSASPSARVSDQMLIQRYVAQLTTQGWQIISQTESSVQLRKPKKWSSLLLILGAVLIIFWGVGIIFLLLAILDYVIKKEHIIYVTADELRTSTVKMPPSDWRNPMFLAGAIIVLVIGCIAFALISGLLISGG